MIKASIYNQFFERCGYMKFWGKILSKKDPHDMANELRILVMKKFGMLKALHGEKELAYFVVQFVLLADDLERSRSNKISLRQSTSREYVSIFRTLLAKGEVYKREPDDQSGLFSSHEWTAVKKNK